MWVGGQRYGPAALPPGKGPGTHCTKVWVFSSVSSDGCGKPRLHLVSIPGPVASRYPDQQGEDVGSFVSR
jgi:hypothetical protein